MGTSSAVRGRPGSASLAGPAAASSVASAASSAGQVVGRALPRRRAKKPIAAVEKPAAAWKNKNTNSPVQATSTQLQPSAVIACQSAEVAAQVITIGGKRPRKDDGKRAG